MVNKIINFLLEQIDKIILAIIGLVCAWILIGYVVLNPNLVKYNNRPIRPAQIDSIIKEKASLLDNKLQDDPEELSPYQSKLAEFNALFESPINTINDDAYFPLPKISDYIETVERIYRVPKAGQTTDVSAEFYRTVAYIPTEEVDLENTYAQSETEPNDIDFVSVQGTFDMSRLYKNFHESFAGNQVQQDWRDPCMARPVFAAVQLQRQQLLDDGTWSEWKIIPRSKVDDYRTKLVIPEKVKQLPLGIKALLVQLNNKQITYEVLQPSIYDIASADETWYPPKLHKKYVRQLEEQREEESRARRTSERERRSSPTRRGEREAGAVPTDGMVPGGTMSRRTTRPDRSDDFMRPGSGRITNRPGGETGYGSFSATWRGELAYEYKKILIDPKNGLKDLTDLIVWAHDDTVETGQVYRYMMRVGVINPIAGTNQFHKNDAALRSQVLIWSQPSDVTEKIEVPEKMYFFPRERRAASGSVIVQVSKYILGYWYSKDYTINIGDEIGKIEIQKRPSNLASRRNTIRGGFGEPDEPEIINYQTGAILVDVIDVEDWAGIRSLRARKYYEALYTYNGTKINHLPIGDRNWANDVQAKYKEIKESQSRDKQQLKPRSTRSRQQAVPDMKRNMMRPGMRPDMMKPIPGGPPPIPR